MRRVIPSAACDEVEKSEQVPVVTADQSWFENGQPFSTYYAYCIASRISHMSTIYWGRTGGAVKEGGAAPVGATSAAAAEVGAEVVSTTGVLTSVVDSVPCFFSTYMSA
jgi:hypothetical protein